MRHYFAQLPAQAARWRALAPWLYLVALLWISVYCCREAFWTPSTGHFGSQHGIWMALARLAGLEWFAPHWWPYFGSGAPLPYVYAPVVPFAMALLGALGASSPAVALNVVTGLAVCLAPAALYLGAWKLTEAPGFSFLGAVAFALAWPIEDVNKAALHGAAWFGTTRRLYRLLEWDELPHACCALLLPIAAWLAWRALRGGRRWTALAAAATLALMMATSMFGFVLAALLAVTLPLALETGRVKAFVKVCGLAAAGYLMASPWAFPSLLLAVRRNSALSGEANWTLRGCAALAIIAAVTAATAFAARRLTRNEGVRWLALFTAAAVLIPALDHYARLHFLPQPYRYQIEMEMALSLAAAFALRALLRPVPRRYALLLLIPLLWWGQQRLVAQRRFFKAWLKPVDATRSIEDRAARWVDQNLHGRRVFMPGSMAAWLNVRANTPQMTAFPYNTVPDWTQQTALFQIFSGEGAGPREGEVAITWLKAYGVHAIAVSGPSSQEYWKPFRNPRKFEGLLPALWNEDGVTIYGVPSSPSLAHALRPEQLVRHKPNNAVDTAEMENFAVAMADAGAAAQWEWLTQSRARISAVLESGQLISTQITYDRGWRARANGATCRTRADGLGFLVIEPPVAGPVRVDLKYTGGAEALATRAAAILALAGLLAWAWRGRKPATP